ncbi:hypothetical protein Y032_0094g2776 [Ancylostoma ceylanicum]|uniref:Uncharacterized protein n=1 Tax=Ancylostoma ceylanicum TaxID=53326 RepID=A0A016TLE2_9BILA|nr:hypothetical protein Y032_0094g2776 [Ancylostoma ceylanicum]
MRRVDDSGLLAFSVEGRPSCHFVHKYSAIVAYGTHYIRNNESAQAVHVTAKSLVDIIKTTVKRDTQIRDDDVDC